MATRGSSGGADEQVYENLDALPVWLDVDTGVDDALALLLAFRSDTLHVVGVSTVAGNTDVDTVTEATAKVLDVAGASSSVVFTKGLCRPLIEPQHSCPEIHGQDSLGDLSPPLPKSTRKLSKKTAPEELLHMLRKRSEPLSVIALGPLSNIAMCIRLAPQLCKDKINRIMWMGGATSRGGNATQWGEANSVYDPEAAHIVLTAGIPITMYTWDVYLDVAFTAQELLEHTESTNPWSVLAGRLMHRDMAHFKMTSAHIGDAGAVAAFIDPSTATTKKMHVAVELTGAITRGMTVVDVRDEVFPPDRPKGEANVDVVVAVDSAKIKRLYAESVMD